MALTVKQQVFIHEYLIDLNARQAAIRAGYSPKTARDIGPKLLRRPAIQTAIATRLAERSQRVEVQQDRVLLEIARLAFNDPRRAFDANGALLPIQDWPDETAAAIASIKINEIKDADGAVVGETKEIRFWDKGKQLELAARHLGMLNDRLEISTPVSQLIRAARERMAGGALLEADGE